MLWRDSEANDAFSFLTCRAGGKVSEIRLGVLVFMSYSLMSARLGILV